MAIFSRTVIACVGVAIAQPLCLAQVDTQEQTTAVDAVTEAAAETDEAVTKVETTTETETRQSVVVVVGAEGIAEYGPLFREWAGRWQAAAQHANAELQVIGIDDTDGPMTDRELLQKAVQQMGSVQTSEPMWLVLIGHGAFDGRMASFNLRGPDVSASSMAEFCSDVQRPLAVVHCASCSAPFLNALSGPNRVIVTATKDGNQVQYSRFGDAMSQAIGGLDADSNRDGQTSLLEAWLYASRRTAEFYSTEGRLATEHSLLDDNGDSLGVRSESYDGFRPKKNLTNADAIDGRLASRWHLVRSDEERQLTVDERSLRDSLELQIETLRQRRDDLPEDAYLDQLERLLTPLANLYQAAEQRAGGINSSVDSAAPSNVN